MRKGIFIFGLLATVFFGSFVFAAGRDGFVLNVIHNGSQVKEISSMVSLPFYSEYQVRLKNTNDRRATVRLLIDGIPVSKLGDMVIPAKGTVDLERFLDRSLTEGKRFKFVPVTHPEVDDPYSKENGKVIAEFRLEKKRKLEIVPEKNLGMLIGPYNCPDCPYYYKQPAGNCIDLPLDNFSNQTINAKGVDCGGLANTSMNVSNSSAGATIVGSLSNQRFTEISMDMEDEAHVVELKIIGI